MPLSFASQFGGVCTLIGTSTNILVNSIAISQGMEAFGLFEFAPLGLAMSTEGGAVEARSLVLLRLQRSNGPAGSG